MTKEISRNYGNKNIDDTERERRQISSKYVYKKAMYRL